MQDFCLEGRPIARLIDCRRQPMTNVAVWPSLRSDLLATEQAKRLYELGCVTEMDIVQLVYRPTEPQGASKDYEFSRVSMEKRWQQGISDARVVLHDSPWLAPMPKELGVRVFDVPQLSPRAEA